MRIFWFVAAWFLFCDCRCRNRRAGFSSVVTASAITHLSSVSVIMGRTNRYEASFGRRMRLSRMNGRMKNSYLLSASNTLKTSRCGYCHSGWACRPLLSIASCKPIGQSFRSVGLPSRHTGRCQNQPHGYLFCFIPCICVPPTFSALHPTDRAGGGERAALEPFFFRCFG